MTTQKSGSRHNLFPLALFSSAAVLLIIAVATWFSMSAPAGTIGPKLAVNTERIDFGKQPYNNKVRAEFQITNTGDRALTLDASAPVKVVEGC
jgi:hypothetical protein